MIHAIKLDFPKLLFCLHISVLVEIIELRTKPWFEKSSSNKTQPWFDTLVVAIHCLNVTIIILGNRMFYVT